jgi:ketosteroid isomerase-like protein
MTNSKAAQIVGQYYAAWSGGDVNKAIEYLTDDVEILAPNGTFTGPDGYHDFMDGFVAMLTGVSEFTVFGDETTALAWYDTHLAVVPTLTAAERIKLSGENSPPHHQHLAHALL